MLRSKWLRIQTDLSSRQVLNGLLKARFSMESGKGFEPLPSPDAAIRGRFIERHVDKEKIVDPFGEVTELETTRYLTTPFRLHERSQGPANFLLEIGAPSRTVRPLINALSEALGRLTVLEIEWSVLDVYKKIKSSSPKARIIRVKASAVPISGSSEAKIEVSSIADALADYRDLLPRATSHIEKIRIERPFLDASGVLELGISGLCSFDESAEDLVRSLILGIS